MSLLSLRPSARIIRSCNTIVIRVQDARTGSPTRADRAPTPPGYDRLTEREREVLGLLARGGSTDEIARELYIGLQTVMTHVAQVLAKLGARDRVLAVVIAYESGIVQIGE